MIIEVLKSFIETTNNKLSKSILFLYEALQLLSEGKKQKEIALMLRPQYKIEYENDRSFLSDIYRGTRNILMLNFIMAQNNHDKLIELFRECKHLSQWKEKPIHIISFPMIIDYYQSGKFLFEIRRIQGNQSLIGIILITNSKKSKEIISSTIKGFRAIGVKIDPVVCI